MHLVLVVIIILFLVMSLPLPRLISLPLLKGKPVVAWGLWMHLCK